MATTLLNGPPVAKHAPAASPLDGVRAELAAVESLLESSFARHGGAVGALVSHLKHYRGKRLRPVLMLLTGRACGRLTPAHVTLSAVIEMIHTATLVHDDVLDDADVRRHADTVNARWGNQRAILLGDMLFTKAFHLSATLGDARICEWIGHATDRVCAGELMQLTEQGNLHLSEAEYFEIIGGKTAALTECTTRLGAFAAGADAEVVEALATYGSRLGLAFQIGDDLLDLLGTEEAAGKTLGTDLGQGKLTLPVIHALASVSATEAADLRGRMRRLGEGDREAIVSALRRAGSLDYARGVADRLAVEARAALGVLPASAHRETLERLTDWTTRRSA